MDSPLFIVATLSYRSEAVCTPSFHHRKTPIQNPSPKHISAPDHPVHKRDHPETYSAPAIVDNVRNIFQYLRIYKLLFVFNII